MMSDAFNCILAAFLFVCSSFLCMEWSDIGLYLRGRSVTLVFLPFGVVVSPPNFQL
jgi:hypothetical protein